MSDTIFFIFTYSNIAFICVCVTCAALHNDIIKNKQTFVTALILSIFWPIGILFVIGWAINNTLQKFNTLPPKEVVEKSTEQIEKGSIQMIKEN